MKAVHEQLGRVTAQFSFLEMALSHTIQALLGATRPGGEIVTANLPFQAKLDIAGGLFQARLPKDSPSYKRFADVLTACSSVRDRRNTTIHSLWAQDMTGSSDAVRMRARTRQKKGYSETVTSIDSSALEALADDINRVAGELLTFMQTDVQPVLVKQGLPEFFASWE